jgi:hypothetical protein
MHMHMHTCIHVPRSHGCRQNVGTAGSSPSSHDFFDEILHRKHRSRAMLDLKVIPLTHMRASVRENLFYAQDYTRLSTNPSFLPLSTQPIVFSPSFLQTRLRERHVGKNVHDYQEPRALAKMLLTDLSAAFHKCQSASLHGGWCGRCVCVRERERERKREREREREKERERKRERERDWVEEGIE